MKLLKLILIAGGLAGIAYLIGKEVKELKKEEKGSSPITNKGDNKEEKGKKVNEDEKLNDNNPLNNTINNKRDIIRHLYDSIEFGQDWDRDFIRAESTHEFVGFLDSSNNVHVKRSSNNDLEFLFEIPIKSYTEKNFKFPSWRDYVNGIKKFIDSNNYSCRESDLIGFHIISYDVDDNGKTIHFQEAVPIDRKDYKRYEKLNTGGEGVGIIDLAKSVYFSNLEKKEKSRLGDDDLYGDNNPRVDKLTIEYNGNGYSEEDIYNLSVVCPVIFYRVSFHRMDRESAMTFLEKVVEDLYIRGGSNGNEETYDHLIFHPHFPGSDNKDLMYYYTVTSENINDPKFGERKVIVKELNYGNSK